MNVLLLVFAALLAVASCEWVEMAPLPTRRSDHACTLVSNAIYLTGGCASDEVYETDPTCFVLSSRTDAYYPDTDKWVNLADMPRPRNRHVQLSYGGKLYLFGGRTTNDSIVREIDVFDIASNKWSTLVTRYDQPNSDLAGYIVGQQAILFGGYNEDYTVVSNSTTIFNFATSNFTYNVALMKTGRGDLCTGIIDDFGFIFGGYTANFCSPIDNPEEYNPPTRTWKNIVSQNPSVHGGDAACAVSDDKFYVFGGEQKDAECRSKPVNTTQSYDPKTDSWTLETSMTLQVPRFRHCAVFYGGNFHLFGGQGPLVIKNNLASHSLLSDNQVFIPSSSSASFLLPSLSLVLALILALLF